MITLAMNAREKSSTGYMAVIIKSRLIIVETRVANEWFIEEKSYG
jgi:hypothetical protein